MARDRNRYKPSTGGEAEPIVAETGEAARTYATALYHAAQKCTAAAKRVLETCADVDASAALVDEAVARKDAPGLSPAARVSSEKHFDVVDSVHTAYLKTAAAAVSSARAHQLELAELTAPQLDAGDGG